jgi:hypothetical protein
MPKTDEIVSAVTAEIQRHRLWLDQQAGSLEELVVIVKLRQGEPRRVIFQPRTQREVS